MELSRGLLVTSLASLIFAAAMGIAYFLLGGFGRTQQNLLLTAVVVGGFSLTGWACVARSGSWWMWPLRPLGAATSTVALVVVVLRIWNLIEDAEDFWKVLVTLTVLAFTLAHLSLLAAYRPDGGLVWAWRTGAMLAALAMGVLVIGGMWRYGEDRWEAPFVSLVGVAGILDLLGTLALFPLSRLTGKSRKSGGQSPSRSRSPLRPARQR